jgi:hypothetical protein
MLVVLLAAAMILAVWTMRLHARERALRGVAPPAGGAAARSEVQPWGSSAGRAGRRVPQATAQPAGAAMKANAEAKPQQEAPTLDRLRGLIELENDRNVAAIAAAKLRLDEVFRGYSARVPQFVDALNSLPEKARLVKTLIEDKSETDNQIQEEAARLFAENVVPLERLRGDVAAVAARFERDVETNRKILLAAAGPSLDLPQAPPSMAAANMDLLLADFSGQLSRFLGSQAEQVPTASANSLASSVMVEEAMRKKVTAALEENDSKRDRATIVGTAVGVLAAAADYWLLESRFEDALARRCQTALDKIKSALWSDPQNGLEASFARYASLVRESQLLALERAAGK